MISTHTPHARRDNTENGDVRINNISTHTPHARRDPFADYLSQHGLAFQLTRLMRGVTEERSRSPTPPRKFQLTRLMRGVTHPF